MKIKLRHVSLVLLVAMLASAILLTACPAPTPTPTPTPTSPRATASPSPTILPSPTPTATVSPTVSPGPSPSPTGVAITLDLVALNLAFDQDEITVRAGARVTINFDNQDSGIQHNFAVYTDSTATTSIFIGDVITGMAKTTYTFTTPSSPGEYFFRCDTHPAIMTGKFIVTSS